MWKRGLMIFLILTLTLGLAGQALAGTVELVVNGKSVTKDMPAQAMFGKIFVSLKYLTEKMGGQYNWNSKENKATVKLGNTTSTIKVGDTFAAINGVHRWMDFPAYSSKDELMVTFYAAKTALNIEGVWDSNKGIMSINEKKPELLSIKVNRSAGQTQIVFNGSKPLEGSSQYLEDSKQVLVLLNNTLNKTGREKITVNDGGIKDIALTYSTLHNQTKVIVSLNERLDQRLEKGSQLVLTLGAGASSTLPGYTGKAKLRDISFTSLEDKDQFLFS